MCKFKSNTFHFWIIWTPYNWLPLVEIVFVSNYTNPLLFKSSYFRSDCVEKKSQQIYYVCVYAQFDQMNLILRVQKDLDSAVAKTYCSFQSEMSRGGNIEVLCKVLSLTLRLAECVKATQEKTNTKFLFTSPRWRPYSNCTVLSKLLDGGAPSRKAIQARHYATCKHTHKFKK